MPSKKSDRPDYRYHISPRRYNPEIVTEQREGKQGRRYFFGVPPISKPLPRVRKPNLNSDRGQDSNQCAWRPRGSQSTHGSTVPFPEFTAQVAYPQNMLQITNAKKK
ncbi:hypothetical protein E2C01_032617 [Portunus trituberculatus]|uniref:Uncharacterized protein n=1 Tax=Portunus trituberculatus TaxID=210409 RepID=A0A5B7F0W6_PORTR|nr:hypothetical protein [Portunus trituberculatus]